MSTKEDLIQVEDTSAEKSLKSSDSNGDIA